MKAHSIASLVTAFLMMVTLVNGTVGSNGVKPNLDLWGKESEGFRLSVLFEKKQFRRESSIMLHLTIKNVTKRDLYLVETYPADEYKLTVRNERGEDAALTQLGQLLKANEGNNFRVIGVKVRSNEEVRDNIEINKFYVMTAPGAYFITAKRTVRKLSGNSWSEVVSNTVSVRAVP